MKCPYCNNNVPEGMQFCGNCGRNINVNNNVSNELNNQKQTANQNINSSNQFVNNNGVAYSSHNKAFNNNDIINEINQNDILLNAYIGKNIDKLTNNKFSWCCFFFGPFYTLYRKMWKFTFIWFLIVILINFLLHETGIINSFIGLIVNIIAAIIFKERYLVKANNMIKKVKIKYPNSSIDDLAKICKKCGGTSAVPIILLIIMLLAVLVYSFIQASKTRKQAIERHNEIIRQSQEYDEAIRKFNEINQ